MTDTTEAAPANNAADQEAQAAATEEETTAFLDKLEAEAEAQVYDYMQARVPRSMREAFDKRFPKPDPDAPTAAQKAMYPDGAPPQLEQGYVSKQWAAKGDPQAEAEPTA